MNPTHILENEIIKISQLVYPICYKLTS